ncbi:unnamed protein product [Urochloa humidicola]
MANFPVDPQPFVPRGFNLVHREVHREPARIRAFLAPALEKTNEDLAIAITDPRINKEDFGPFAKALQRYLIDNGVHHPEIQQCPIGEALVRFDSAMQREGFLIGAPRQFLGYQLRFIRHDEGINLRDLPLDRVVWLMLLCFPSDARTHVNLVAKSLASFAQLLHVHNSSSDSRLVVKALVNSDSDVPDSVTVSAGLSPLAHSWTVPIFLLNASDVVMGGDEDPIPVEGPTHPMPHHQVPSWMGPHGVPGHGNWIAEDASVNNRDDGDLNASGVMGSQAGDSLGQNAGSENSQDVAAGLQASAQASPSFAVMPLQVIPPPAATLPDLNQQPSVEVNLSLFSLNIPRSIVTSLSDCLTSLIVDLDMTVPSYISDHRSLRFLASIVHDQDEVKRVFGPALPPGGLVPYSDSENEDDVHEIDGPLNVTPSKRRARRPREPLEGKFCRRSKRLNPDVGGFCSAAAQEAANDNPSIYVVSPVTGEPAPHLTVANIQGLAQGYLQMQPEDVSAAVLLELDDVNV